MFLSPPWRSQNLKRGENKKYKEEIATDTKGVCPRNDELNVERQN